MTENLACNAPGCPGPGTIADGYCEDCGAKAEQGAAPGSARPSAAPRPLLTRHRGTIATGSRLATGRRQSSASSHRTAIGAGIVNVPPAATVDPLSVVVTDPTFAEGQGFCANTDCREAVGRGRGGQPGRLWGYCHRCGHRFGLHPGDVLGDQYKVVGWLAHGGLGEIHLVWDDAVGNWVVFKGLLDIGDDAAMTAFVQEKAFLAELNHGNIVRIINFVTHKGSGYIVEEYVGGTSLRHVLQRRREPNEGLPLEEAIAYVLAVLPTLSYLHSRSLLYCDLHPGNLIHVGDQVKLIDLGAVRRFDSKSVDVFGTLGYEAPEVPEDGPPEVPKDGPSIASDLYSVGRTLAKLALDFEEDQFEYSLPDPASYPVLAEFDSFHRFLLKATAPHPDDRFQNADEMRDQLLGVLREVVTLKTGRAHPAPSAVFGAAIDDEGLPPLAVDVADPFLSNLATNDPQALLEEIKQGIAAGHAVATNQVRLRRAGALIETGDVDAALAELDQVGDVNPWEWRVAWLRGVSAIARRETAAALDAFDRCWLEVPGELAPKLGAALAYERAGDFNSAAVLYQIVVTVDPSLVAAAMGLARCCIHQGDVDGALAAYDRIPDSHRAFSEAQVRAVRVLIEARRYADIPDRLGRLPANEPRRVDIDIERFQSELRNLYPGAQRPSPSPSLRDRLVQTRHRFRPTPEEHKVRKRLKEALHRHAHRASTPVERRRGEHRASFIDTVDRANSVRPWTWR